MGPHTTSDDPTRYRDPAAMDDEWRAKDPIDRIEQLLETKGVVRRRVRGTGPADRPTTSPPICDGLPRDRRTRGR